MTRPASPNLIPRDVTSLAEVIIQLGYAESILADGVDLFEHAQWEALAAEAGVDTPTRASRAHVVADIRLMTSSMTSADIADWGAR